MDSRRFVVDTMLGRLARWLRAMGYDTLYPGQIEDRALLRLAIVEDRVLVTRDRMLALLAAPRGCLVRAEVLDEQIRETVSRLALVPREEAWLSRCLDCNARLEPCPRDALADRLPAPVLATHAEFVACPGCEKVYWGGSHAERIVSRLERLLGATRETGLRFGAPPPAAPPRSPSA